MRIATLLLSLLLAAPADAWPRHGASAGGGALAPGLVLGTYGATGAAGWTRIGPSNGMQASGATTNVIFVSDFLGNDNRDGSTPTFVDDGVTEQFNITTGSATATAVYKDLVSGQSCTVAVTIASKTFMQCGSRTGTPSASGTLTKQSGTGDATLTYSAVTLGIHGPVKTLIKGFSGSGPEAPASLDNVLANQGDGTGLGTIGNWRTAGGVGSAFALRDGKPDWLLLRMGDTWVGQAIEAAWTSGGGSDNFQKSGFSEQEPMVISAYDENFPVATNGPNVGARARPIILTPSANDTYAFAQPAGTIHQFSGRPGMNLTAGRGNYVAVMGLYFYSAQRDPNNTLGAYYVGAGNIDNNSNIAVDHRGGFTGSLIEDTRASWYTNGFTYENASGSSLTPSNFDVTVRRSQVDHCYSTGSGHHSGIIVDSAGSVGGGSGGAMSTGVIIDENVMDQCGWSNNIFTGGDSFSRNAYLQWDAVAGSRRGNTSTRSASESMQFRAGGTIDNNFFYNGSYGSDVGHQEGDPTLTSSTVYTNNVVMAPVNPIGVAPVGVNFYNSSNVTASGNIVANQDSSVGAPGTTVYVQTDPNKGNAYYLNLTNAGTGGTPGNYAIATWSTTGGSFGCTGYPTNFTGGTGTTGGMGVYNMVINGGGTITPDPLVGGLNFLEPSVGGTFSAGDALTPVANYPSINTTGTSLTAVGTGGTLGDYGTAFGHCPRDVSNPNAGDTQVGVPLVNFSGSMAGSGAAATFSTNTFTGITRALNGGTGTYWATGLTTNTNNIGQGAPFGVGGVGGVGSLKFTVTGATPSAYNGTWTALTSNQFGLIWDTGLAADPGPVTVPGNVTAYAIVATGKGYVAGDVETIASTDIGGQTGVRITVGTVAHLSGWTVSVRTLETQGVQGLTWTGNIVFNWAGQNPPNLSDCGGPNSTNAGCGGNIPAGGGVANTFTGNSNCAGSQFTGVITGTNTLTTSALVNGPIAIGQNLAGPGVMANTTITGGSGTSWTVSPNQTAPSATMYGYTCTPTKVYAHPERTAATYAGSLGITPATLDGYLYGDGSHPGAMNNAKWNWNPAYTANNGLNPYIRLGFQ